MVHGPVMTEASSVVALWPEPPVKRKRMPSKPQRGPKTDAARGVPIADQCVTAKSEIVFFIGVSVSFCPFTTFLRRSPEKVTGKVEEFSAGPLSGELLAGGQPRSLYSEEIRCADTAREKAWRAADPARAGKVSRRVKKLETANIQRFTGR